MNLIVNVNECTGCELCVDRLPDVFKMNSKGISVVIDSRGASENQIEDVIRNCPAECIYWE